MKIRDDRDGHPFVLIVSMKLNGQISEPPTRRDLLSCRLADEPRA